MQLSKRALGLLFIVFLVVSCGGGSTGNTPTSQPTEITLFTVDRTSVTGVEEVKITWEIKNAKNSKCSVFRDYRGKGSITQKELSTQCKGSITHTPAAEVQYVVAGLKNDGTENYYSKSQVVMVTASDNSLALLPLPLDPGTYKQTTEITVNTCSDLLLGLPVGGVRTKSVVFNPQDLFFFTRESVSAKDGNLYVSTSLFEAEDLKEYLYILIKSRTEFETLIYTEGISQNCTTERRSSSVKIQ